jgi:hypothetical protein
MPPVSWPTASIFWAWRSACSARSRSPTSAWSRIDRRAQIGGPLLDPRLERLVDPAQRVGALLPFGDVVGDADEADMLAGPGPQRGCEIERSQRHSPSARWNRPSSTNKRIEASPAIDSARIRAFVLLVDDRPPVIIDGLFVGDAEEVDIGAVDEAAPAVELGHPDRHRRRIRDQPEPFLALAQPFLDGSSRPTPVTVPKTPPITPSSAITGW